MWKKNIEALTRYFIITCIYYETLGISLLSGGREQRHLNNHRLGVLQHVSLYIKLVCSLSSRNFFSYCLSRLCGMEFLPLLLGHALCDSYGFAFKLFDGLQFSYLRTIAFEKKGSSCVIFTPLSSGRFLLIKSPFETINQRSAFGREKRRRRRVITPPFYLNVV